MKHHEEEERLRQYLLGELSSEEQQQQLEKRLLTDDSVFEELLIAEDDLIDSYLSGELIGEEKERFENHFLATEERRRKLQFSKTLRKYVAAESAPVTDSTPEKKPHWLYSIKAFFASPMGAAVALMVVLACGLGLWRVFIYQSDINKGLIALKTAYREQRPTEARITQLDYAPLPQTRGNEPDKVDNLSRERAQRYLLDAVKDNPGPASYHALGLFYLTERKFDQAIEQFKKALETNQNDARIQSDLGAALLEKGKLDRLNGENGKSLEEFAESLEHLNRAISLDDSLLPALFNRALCHQYMLLPQQAADDWAKYLAKDSQSPWANEARENLKLIESQKNTTSQDREQVLQDFLTAYKSADDEAAWRILSLNRNVTGCFIENTLLDRYLEARAKARAGDALENLEALSYAGELELKRANDHFISDLVRFYQSTTEAQLPLLTEARALMSEGHKALQSFNPEKAVEYYDKARLTFERTRNEGESVYIKYPMAHAYLLTQLANKSELSLSGFQAVVRASEVHQYRWLLAQALNGMGNVQTGLNDYSTALEHSNRSWEISEQIDDLRGLMKTADQLSNEYTRLGNYHKAIENQQRGLALFNKGAPEPMQVWRSYFLIATPLYLLGLNAAAADFQKEALRVATKERIAYSICRSYISLGLIYGGQRNYEEATRNVRMAFELAKNIQSDATRADTVTYASLQLGHLYRQAGDFNKAMASYDEVLKTYEGSDSQAFLYAAHKGKLLSCIAQGGCPTVEQEIETTLNLFENYRSKILEEENKFIFFDVEQNVYDVVIDYEHSVKQNSQMAFEFSERSRARSLLDLTRTETVSLTAHSNLDKSAAPVSQPMTLEEIRQQMPEQTQILQYSVLYNKILIWLISKSGVLPFAQAIDAKELREKASNYLQLLSSPPVNNEEEVKRASADFYDLLIKPVESSLDRNKQLCIVPDKVLNYLPYGAFISRSSGKYLTQQYTLIRAPSSNLFIISSEKARGKSEGRAERLLSVGNPAFDHKVFPTLADLPSAKREAEQVAAYYNPALAIAGDKALKNRVVTEMEGADVIHLALHAVVNEQSPLRSKLLFASTASSDSGSVENDILQAQEIYKLRLPQTRLVILSACQSGAGRYYDGEGMISIARPFIARGVPLVVASLWPVDSNTTADLMISFHKLRKSGNLSTAEALRLAQREMLDNPDERYRQPYYWASFITVGGYAQF
jgi:CHAT domain-containing protein/Tfp pilus assembly protein PilF